MRTIQKGREPKLLETYRQRGGATFDTLPTNVKEKIQEQLVAEQRGLCCYCQSRIRTAWNGMKIEHWQSQSPNKYPQRQLDYSNLLGACLGGQRHGEKSPKEHHHCDTLKGDDDLCFSVCDQAHLIERQIRFLGNGEITSDDDAIKTAINEILNLNLGQLVSNRKAVLDAFKERLGRGKLDATRELQKWDGSQPGDLPEYAQVMVFWLEKKIARAAA